MTREIKYCEICGKPYAETHHIIYRRHCKPLENCKLNQIDLCCLHHRDHKQGAHHNKELDTRLKLEFQNKLEILWDKQYLTREEINEVLQISDKALNRLLKTLSLQKGLYVREEVIRQCMGNKLILEEGKNND